MIFGDVVGQENVLCRVHSSCLHGHVFNSIECDCQEQMNISQRLIQEEGKGIIIWLNHEGKGNGHVALVHSIKYKRDGIQQSDAYKLAGYQEDARDFSAAARILKDLEVKSVRMLTNNPKKMRTIIELGINVTGNVQVAAK